MRQHEEQSGNEADDEPLRNFLISAFGPMKEVEPDYLQSSRAGAKKGKNCAESTSESDGDNDQDGSDEADSQNTAKKPKSVRVKGD